MPTVTQNFKVEDRVRNLEDIYSIVYDKVFPKGHSFVVIDVLPLGLTLEDKDGYRLVSAGFMRFEVYDPRGNYRQNESRGWHSNS